MRAVNAAAPGPWSAPSTLAPDPPPRFDSAHDFYLIFNSVEQTDIIVIFSETLSPAVSDNLDGYLNVFPQAFSVTVGSQTYYPASADAIAGAATASISLKFIPALPGGEAMTVTYTAEGPDGGPVYDLTGDRAPAFTDQPMVNYPAAPAVTLAPGDAALTVRWTEPPNGGAPITRYAVQRRRSGPTNAWSPIIYVDAPARSHRITGLTNDTAYDVRVRALNTAAPSGFGGPWSEVATATPVEADTTAPLLSSATHDGDTATRGTSVTLVFDEPLDTASVPARSAFAITVDSASAVSPQSVAFAAGQPDTVLLELPSSRRIDPGDTVTVAYTAPTVNPLQDLSQDPSPNPVAGAAWTVANVPAAPFLFASGRRYVSLRCDCPHACRRRLGGHRLRIPVQGVHRAADSAYGPDPPFLAERGGPVAHFTFVLRPTRQRRLL